METGDEKYLAPTDIIDSHHETIMDYAAKVVGDRADPIDRAVRLYYAVRDGIWYDPYYPFYLPEHYRASNVLKSGRGYCVCKASLLCALGRAKGIPSRIGFADVRNHLATKQLIDYIGSDLFVFHGFVEFYLEGKWVKATPAFNKELCHKHHVLPLEFSGREDSIFQQYSLDGKRFMEYVAFHGIYHDIPVDTIVAAWEEGYGKDRVREWIEGFEKAKGKPIADFFSEEVWKGE
jgi:transglutaminase-like putative cysteine protease